MVGNTKFISRVEHDISLVRCAHLWDIMFNTRNKSGISVHPCIILYLNYNLTGLNYYHVISDCKSCSIEVFCFILLSSYQWSQNLQILNYKCHAGAKVRVEMPNPGMCFTWKWLGEGDGHAHLDLADALKVMEKKFSYCYYKMAYCAYSCAYSRLLVKYLLARSRNLLWPLDEEDIK